MKIYVETKIKVISYFKRRQRNGDNQRKDYIVVCFKAVAKGYVKIKCGNLIV